MSPASAEILGGGLQLNRATHAIPLVHMFFFSFSAHFLTSFWRLFRVLPPVWHGEPSLGPLKDLTDAVLLSPASTARHGHSAPWVPHPDTHPVPFSGRDDTGYCFTEKQNLQPSLPYRDLRTQGF